MRELVLGIETSCDETAAAVVDDDGIVLSSVVASQADLHARYGGVVPEIASRRHLELVAPVIRAALEDASAELGDIGRIGVTQGPGLVGALLVGLSAAKALAWARGLPLVPVDHLRGHVATLYLEPDPLEPPFTCLLASGGHTMVLAVRDRAGFEVLGSTVDDAAGEAFDKGARLLGLAYPGGAELDRLAREGDPEAFSFPVAKVPGLDFSFSGLKTALLYAVRNLEPAELEARRADLAASYQRAIVRALAQRTLQAAEETGAERIAIVGGVAANSELRAALPGAAAPPLELVRVELANLVQKSRLETGEREVEPRHARHREVVRLRISFLGEAVDRRAARIAEAEEPRSLVEGLARSVVQSRPQDLEPTSVLHVEQERVSPARQQAEKRRIHGVRLQEERSHVTV